MIPLSIDPSRVSIALIGRGAALLDRLRRLVEAGADRVAVFSDDDDGALADLAGAGLRSRLPDGNDLAATRLVWIAGLPKAEAAALAARARAAGALVNVEDERAACDFHNVAQVRRGDLLLTVSTGGKSPGLAARLRQKLERQFGPEWGARVAALGAARAAWQAEGHAANVMAQRTDARIDAEGWLG